MDEREAFEVLAAADHAAYVVERAQANVQACAVKADKAQAQLAAAEAAGAQARGQLVDAEERLVRAAEAADAVPIDLRAFVMANRPDIAAAHVANAEAAQADGGAS